MHWFCGARVPRQMSKCGRMGLVLDQNAVFGIRAVTKMRLQKPVASGIPPHQVLPLHRECLWVELDYGTGSRTIFIFHFLAGFEAVAPEFWRAKTLFRNTIFLSC